ncbi:hypothetical protein HN51_031494 [Arachis hypogaea]
MWGMNTKWRFLEGVRVSNALPPRTVLVQQCICDKGVLEVLCNYVSWGESSMIQAERVLSWGEGYYNRDIKTRKTRQGVELNSDQIGLQRSEQLRELYKSLKVIDASPQNKDFIEMFNHRHLVDTFRDYKYLGTRNRVDGTVGEYKWMTFGEAGTARSAIGSGLIYYGIPKGAVLTHANFIENVAGTTMDEKFGPSDVYISYLPLAHIYELTNQVMHV